MKTIIAGSRTITDATILPKLIPTLPWEITTVVTGCAKGADRLGQVWAYENGIEIDYFPANWDKYGLGAGFKRNEVMAEHGDALLLLWDGSSRGSMDMLARAKEHGLRIRVETYDPTPVEIPPLMKGKGILKVSCDPREGLAKGI